MQTQFLTSRSKSVEKQSPTEPWVAHGLGTDLPSWVQGLVPGVDDTEFCTHGDMKVRTVAGKHVILRTVVIPNAVHLSGEALTHATREGYEAILDSIEPDSITTIGGQLPL